MLLTLLTARGLAGQEAPAAVTPGETPVESTLTRLATHSLAELDRYRDTPRSARALLINNLSRYFAIYQVPSNLEELQRLLGAARRINQRFAEELIEAAAAETIERGASRVSGDDMARVVAARLPNQPTPYNELVFFPRAGSDAVAIETFDLDAYRDSGAAWEALVEVGRELTTDANLPPLDMAAAAELARATISYGLLVLRLGGRAAAEDHAPELATRHLRDASRRLEELAQARAPEPTPKPAGSHFVDRTEASGVRFRHVSSRWVSRLRRLQPRTTTFSGGGVAAADLDGDGWPDLLICGGRGCRSFVNQRDGSFRDSTSESGLEVDGEARMPLPADFDNDGDQDVFITYARDTNRLFENRGDGTFVDITAASGLELAGDVSGAAAAFDADGDGLLDLYIANFGNWVEGEISCCGKDATNGMANRLYRNLGGLRFVEVSEAAGIGNTGWAQAVSHADVDRDGDQDIYIANDFGRNDLLLNQGDGTFVSAGSTSSSDGFYHGMNVSFADLNRDRLADIFITNIWHWHPIPRAVTETNTLLLSVSSDEAGDVRYERYEEPAFVDLDTGWSWAGLFFDVDNDADDDLFIANGFNGYFTAIQHRPHPERPDDLYPINNSYEANILLTSDGGIPAAPVEGFGAEMAEVNSRSAALLDYDRDGDLDLALTTFHADARLFENVGVPAGNHWLVVELEGDPATGTNRDAIGAQIVARTEQGAEIWRTVTGGEGYLARSTLEVEIGLGSATSVDLEIDWPGGSRSIHAGIAADRAVRIRQGSDEIEVLWEP